jgi:hypothetical protein
LQWLSHLSNHTGVPEDSETFRLHNTAERDVFSELNLSGARASLEVLPKEIKSTLTYRTREMGADSRTIASLTIVASTITIGPCADNTWADAIVR